MAILNRRTSTTPTSRSARRSRLTNSKKRSGAKKRHIVAPSEFHGKDAISNARRSIARGARKVAPTLNREIA